MKKIIIIALAVWGVILLIFGGIFLFHLFNNGQLNKEGPVATQTKVIADRNTPTEQVAKTEEPVDNRSEYEKFIEVNLSEEDLKDMYEEYSNVFDDISMPSRSEERTSAAREVG